VHYPLYVAFFVLAGAELHLDLLLGSHGSLSHQPLPLIAAYILGRTLGKLASRGDLESSLKKGVKDAD